MAGETVPTFEIGNGRRIGPDGSRTWSLDRCSVHGDIPANRSIADHLREVHGLAYDEWLALAAARREGWDAALAAVREAASRYWPESIEVLAALDRLAAEGPQP